MCVLHLVLQGKGGGGGGCFLSLRGPHDENLCHCRYVLFGFLYSWHALLLGFET